MKQLIFVALAMLLGISNANAEELDVWFGTGRNNACQSAGIYHSTFDTDTGKLSNGQLAFELSNAGWITWHPELDMLYSTGSLNGKPAICVLKLNADKSLSMIQGVNINHGSCFLTTDQTGKILISTQYGGGTTISLPIDKDGKLVADAIQEFQHTGGSNVVPGRQKSPHPHYAGVSPDNQFVFVPDLGLDQLVVYELDTNARKLVPLDRPVKAVTGGGPRHMKFRGEVIDETRQFAFVLNELAMSLSCFELKKDGGMELLETKPTLDEAVKEREVFNSGSEVRVHPNGKFIYTGNRGNDSISLFHFASRSMTFKRHDVTSIHGTWPRNFNLTPDGKWLLAAGAQTNSISVFAIDQADGTLTFQGKPAFVPGAICVSFR